MPCNFSHCSIRPLLLQLSGIVSPIQPCRLRVIRNLSSEKSSLNAYVQQVDMAKHKRKNYYAVVEGRIAPAICASWGITNALVSGYSNNKQRDSFVVVQKVRERPEKVSHYGTLWRMVDKLEYINTTKEAPREKLRGTLTLATRFSNHKKRRRIS
ncbi:hypothetical protein WAI453_013073 [Rhynchosporium graminicola]